MMDVKTPFDVDLTDGGLNFDQAFKIHRLHLEECLTATQIAHVSGMSLQWLQTQSTARPA